MRALRARPRRGRGALAAVIALAVACGFTLSIGPLGAGPAEAMTQLGTAQGYPGDTVQVQVQNQQLGPANTYWVIAAPPGTSIVSASGAAASGLGTFSCSGFGPQTLCGPSNSAGWGANNIVTMQLALFPEAPAGITSGTSTIAGESAPFSVTVLPPPAPTITAPGSGTQTLETMPAISGTKRAGNAATVVADGVEAPLCTVPVDGATTWTCIPTSPLTPGEHTLTATQSSPAGNVSPASAPVTVTVLEPAALALVQSGPTDAVPTVSVTHDVTVTNPGPGAALATSLSVDPGGFPATTCTIGGTTTDCAAVAGGVALGDLAAGSSTTVALTGSAPDGTPVGTSYSIEARVSSISDAASPVTSTSTVTVAAPGAPRITKPASGTRTTDRTPTFSGVDALPGATVSVVRGGGTVCSARAGSAGEWSCSPGRNLDYGLLRVAAEGSLGGAVSAHSAVIEVEIVPVPPPVATPPAPPAQPAPPAVPAPQPSAGAAPRPSAAAPPAPSSPSPQASATPAPKPGSGSGSAGPGSGGSGTGSGGAGGASGAGSANSPLPMDLRLSVGQIQPGSVVALRGTLGPNALAKPSDLTLSAFISPGMIYRTVSMTADGRTVPCTVGTTTFSCRVSLAQGESAAVEIRIYADPLNAPALPTQQLSLVSSASRQSNSLTTTMALAGTPNDTQQYADQLTTFNITTFPGAFIPLLSMLLLALAATAAEAGRRRRRPSSPSQPPSNPPGSET